jgi:hypothetical protein
MCFGHHIKLSNHKLHEPTTFTTVTGCLFTLLFQTSFSSMGPSSVAVYLHIWFKHV